MYKDITPIVDNQLCLSCGACGIICPTDVITYHETEGGHIFPKIDYSDCIDCVLCADVCPGINLSKEAIKNIPSNPFVGEYKKVFTTQSRNKTIFENSQSGGAVTQILFNALSNGYIGAVVVAETQEQIGTSPRSIGVIVTNPNDLYITQKSKYVPIPLLSTLTDIEKLNIDFAIVGVSCHIHGLMNLMEKKKKLRKKLKFKIGLICDRVMTYAGMDFLIKQSGIKESVQKFEFRDKSHKGYPGYIKIESSNKLKYLPPEKRMEIKDHFTPLRCRLCFDKMNIYADITVGDPHGLKGVDRNKGESLVIVRTDVGHELIESCFNANALTCKEIDGDFMEGQGLHKKENEWKQYISLLKQYGRPIPNYIDSIMNKIDNKTVSIENSIVEKVKLADRLFSCEDRNKLNRTLQRKLKSIDIKVKIFKLLLSVKNILK